MIKLIREGLSVPRLTGRKGQSIFRSEPHRSEKFPKSPKPKRIEPNRFLPVLRLSLLRFVDSKLPGNSPRTWEFHPFTLTFCLSPLPDLTRRSLKKGQAKEGQTWHARVNCRVWQNLYEEFTGSFLTLQGVHIYIYICIYIYMYTHMCICIIYTYIHIHIHKLCYTIT